VEVQSLILAGVAALLLFGGINGFRKGAASVAPGVSIPRSNNASLFERVVLLQVILGGLALAGAIVLYLKKTPEQVAEEPAEKRPQHREKPSFATMVRDPNAKNSSHGSKDDAWRKSVIGTWRLPLDGSAAGEITYSSNGRMSGRITLGIGGSRKEELIWNGTWDVREGRMCEEIEQSDMPDVLPVGRKTKDKIIEVNEKEFRSFDAEVGEAVTLHRTE
jgi:hypothetical protein